MILRKTLALTCLIYASILWDMLWSLFFFEHIDPIYFIQHEANRGFVNLLLNYEIPWLEFGIYAIAPIGLYLAIKNFDEVYQEFDGDARMQSHVKKLSTLLYVAIVSAVSLRFVAPMTWYVDFQDILSFMIVGIFRPAIFLIIGYSLAGWFYVAYRLHKKKKEAKACLM